MTQSINGTGDSFPKGQCTYWASFRYHQMTGYYVPFSGDAYQWAHNAPKYGWINSPSPVVPSIICLQPGIQEADGGLGHVGVVEKINPDGTVTASNLNWGLTAAARGKTANVNFHSGSGVSFIYAVDTSGKPIASNGTAPPSTGVLDFISTVTGKVQFGANDDVATFLTNLDTALQLVNPFDVPGPGESDVPSVTLWPTGPTISDPFAWIADVATNFFYDTEALIVRSVFIVIAVVIVVALIEKTEMAGINKLLEPVGGVQGAVKIAGAVA